MLIRWLGLGAGVLLVAVVGLLAALLWRADMPPVPDWQGAKDRAVDGGDCVQTAYVLTAAMMADVPQAFSDYERFFMRDDGQCAGVQIMLEAEDVWWLYAAPQSAAEAQEQARDLAGAWRDWPGPVRRALLMMQGVQPGFYFRGYDYSAAYPGLGLATRRRLVWLLAGCDPVMGQYGGPDWPRLENGLLPDGAPRGKGAWAARSNACAAEIETLITEIGVGATGPEGALVEDLLINAPLTDGPAIDYLRAQRALDHKLAHEWVEPDPDGVLLRRRGIGDLYMAAFKGHPEAAERVAHLAAAGDFAWAVQDMPKEDEAVAAFLFFLMAQHLGRPVAQDVSDAAAQLTDARRREAEERFVAWKQGLAGE
jgi:hypothetical protein